MVLYINQHCLEENFVDITNPLHYPVKDYKSLCTNPHISPKFSRCANGAGAHPGALKSTDATACTLLLSSFLDPFPYLNGLKIE